MSDLKTSGGRAYGAVQSWKDVANAGGKRINGGARLSDILPPEYSLLFSEHPKKEEPNKSRKASEIEKARPSKVVEKSSGARDAPKKLLKRKLDDTLSPTSYRLYFTFESEMLRKYGDKGAWGTRTMQMCWMRANTLIKPSELKGLKRTKQTFQTVEFCDFQPLGNLIEKTSTHLQEGSVASSSTVRRNTPSSGSFNKESRSTERQNCTNCVVEAFNKGCKYGASSFFYLDNSTVSALKSWKLQDWQVVFSEGLKDLSLFQRAQLLDTVSSKEIAECLLRSIPEDSDPEKMSFSSLRLTQGTLKKWKRLVLQAGRHYFVHYTTEMSQCKGGCTREKLVKSFRGLVDGLGLSGRRGPCERQIELSLNWLFLKLIDDFTQK
jgi:hypothetical protein